MEMSQEAIDLDEIKICRNENAVYGEREILSKRLNLSISTWLKLYDNLTSTDYRVEMRDVSILIAKKLRSEDIYISEHGLFNIKFTKSKPYHFFLTTVDKADMTHNQPYSVTFHEIIDYTTGELIDSLHINFLSEMLWLLNEYMLAAQVPKMTIICNKWKDPSVKFDIPFDIDVVEIEMPEFGCQHSQISIFKYKGDKIRIMISSSNISAEDWHSRTQGLWISPFLPLLPIDADYTEGESPTNFKQDFIEFLKTYNQPEVFGWLSLIYRTDCSAINVFFIGSVPGLHQGSTLESWGLKKLSKLLSEHVSLPVDSDTWPIISQCSSIGTFGSNYQRSWLCTTLVRSMSKEKDKRIIIFPDFKLIYPSQNNYNESYDKEVGSTCLKYTKQVSLNQEWLKNYFHQWKSDVKGRSQAIPHLKCYARISPDNSELAWFILTSANVSKAAWGMTEKQLGYKMYNYEAGVLFLPQFLINQNTFPIKELIPSRAPIFILPYDLPLTPYETSDEPFVILDNNEINEHKNPNPNTASEELNLDESKNS